MKGFLSSTGITHACSINTHSTRNEIPSQEVQALLGTLPLGPNQGDGNAAVGSCHQEVAGGHLDLVDGHLKERQAKALLAGKDGGSRLCQIFRQV